MSGINNLPNIGDKIYIVIKLKENKKKYYSSQILDIIDKNTFIISGPMYQKSLIFLHLKENIDIIYIKKGRGRYKFSAKVQERKMKNIYNIEIVKVGDIGKVQQREYYRFNIGISVEKIYKTKIGHEEKNIKENCTTKNISGNGMKLMCNFKHNIGDKIICNFHIMDVFLSIKSKVIRIAKIDAFDFKYAIGVKFLDIEDKERDIIVKYIFKQERILRRKGMI